MNVHSHVTAAADPLAAVAVRHDAHVHAHTTGVDGGCQRTQHTWGAEGPTTVSNTQASDDRENGY